MKGKQRDRWRQTENREEEIINKIINVSPDGKVSIKAEKTQSKTQYCSISKYWDQRKIPRTSREKA